MVRIHTAIKLLAQVNLFWHKHMHHHLAHSLESYAEFHHVSIVCFASFTRVKQIYFLYFRQFDINFSHADEYLILDVQRCLYVYEIYVFNTYVDAVLVRRVIIGLGNCSCELLKDLFGELSGDDIFTYQQFFSS